MSDRFILFNDEQLDAKQVMMLQDLARLLLKNEQTQVKIQKFPYYDPINNMLITSAFWSNRRNDIETTVLNTDVMLAAYCYILMDETILNEIINNNTFKHPKFLQQLFKLLEDKRVLNEIVKQRPSTKDAIHMRNEIRLSYTSTQITVYKTKKTFTDLLFLYFESSFLSENFYDILQIGPHIDDILTNMYQYLPTFFYNDSSESNMYLAERIMFQIDDILNEDMLHEYYHLPKKVYEAIHELKFEDIKRTDASNTDKSSNNDHDEESVSEDIESNHQD